MSDSVKRISPPLGLKEELVVNEVEQRNWKGILISLLVIASICSLILLSILLLSPHFGGDNKNDRLGLDEILFKGYQRKGYNGSWLSDRELLYEDNQTLYIYNVDTQYRSILADSVTLKSIEGIKSFSVSADRRFILLTDANTKNYKRTGSHTFTAKYKIYDTKSNLSVPLKMPDLSEDLQYASWAPKANQLIVIHRNNIYLFFRVGDDPIQITSNGREGFIYNGIPDLMYEEYILESPTAYWWLNDGSRLCFATFDNSLVDQMPYILYGDKNTSFQSQAVGVIGDEFPKVYTYPYSKPGRENAKVVLSIVHINAPNYQQIRGQLTPPDEIRNWDYYITAPPVWVTSTSISVVWSRRSQNYTVISICKEEDNWNCKKIIEEKLIASNGWLVINDAPIFSDDKKYFFIRMPVMDGIFGTFNHIAMIYTEGGRKYFLTHGQFVVTEIYGYRSDLNTLYFKATSPDDPGKRHIYSVTDMNSENPRQIQCLSCNASEECLFNDAIFSPNRRYYIFECLGPGIPKTNLLTVDDNRFIVTLEDNQVLREWYEKKSLPKIKYLSIPTTNGYTIRVQMILPKNLVEEDEIKYPSVIELKSRPNVQSVSYEHKLDWSRYLASKKEYISIHIDGRGTEFQGDKYAFEIYSDLGKVETQDLILTIKYLKDKFSYIDEDKIVVWGRDYGGFLTVSLLATDPIVTCAIAVSPITNWKNYISVFSERYMGLPWPQHNYINYEKTDLTEENLLTKLKGKTFLLVHGTSDKRVNIHHSMLLMKKLTELAVQFKVQMYPDSGIIESWDILVLVHFYRTMEDFFAKCFQVEEDEEEDLLPITRVIKGIQSKRPPEVNP